MAYEPEDEPKIVATLMATALKLQGSTSVAYVLFDNGDIKVMGGGGDVRLPFKKEEARILMQAKLDGKACNY